MNITNNKILDDDKWYKRTGKIKSVKIGVEDHGFFMLSIDFDFGGSGQAFVCTLDDPVHVKNSDDNYNTFICRCGTQYGCEILRRLCRCFDVEDIYNIKGYVAYALYESDDLGEFIKGIENPRFNKSHSDIRQIIPQDIKSYLTTMYKIQDKQLPYEQLSW